MFVWPEQIANKFVAAHSDPTDDLVDRLNHVYTVGLFMFLATLTGAKQHFGTAIQCMAPTHFPGTWVDYVQDYCFVSNTYMVNTSKIITKGDATNVLKEEIWVPYVLLLQALLCYLPKFLWNTIIVTRVYDTGLDMRSVMEEAMKLPSITTLSVRRKHLKRVANLAIGCIKYGQRRSFEEDREQFICNHIFQFMEEMFKGNNWKVSGVFPLVTFCDVKIAQMGQVNTHTMQCFLMINALNEKLYLVLWFWLSALVLIDAVSAINSTLLLICPCLHYTRVLSLLQADDNYIGAEVKRSLLDFTENVLRLDGILLLSFMKDRLNGLIARDLTREIWFTVNRCSRTHCVRVETCNDQVSIAILKGEVIKSADFIGDTLSSTKSRLGGINAFDPVVRKNA
uniref:Innexin n=1 Tax=Wuchereria bancrofti TaxID=6293 RepID=A0A1I8F183_WUCBA